MLLPITVLLNVSLVACSDAELGNDLVWKADHETTTLSEWQLDAAGGIYEENGTVLVTSERARTGTYSAKLSATTDSGASVGLYRDVGAEDGLYFAAWYLIPTTVDVTTGWTIMQLRSRIPQDPAVIAQGLDLNLRSRPDGALLLYVFDHRPEYLQSPLADPPPTVPVGSWFHLEAYVLSLPGKNGKFSVWLDGNLVYEIADRRIGNGENIYFTPGSNFGAASPAPVEVFVDDVAISLSPVTPDGVLRLP